MRIIEFFKQLVFKLKAKRQGLYYMNGTEGLPLPLTEQEEGECLKRLAAGDEQVKQKLIERNLRLVVYIARKFDNTGIDLDDLISIGSIGLIKAINSYNVEKKIKLATFASRCIENEILMYLRRTQKTKGEVSFDEPERVTNSFSAIFSARMPTLFPRGLKNRAKKGCCSKLWSRSTKKKSSL